MWIRCVELVAGDQEHHRPVRTPADHLRRRFEPVDFPVQKGLVPFETRLVVKTVNCLLFQLRIEESVNAER